MSIRQGFTVEHAGEYRPAFAAAAEAGFDYVELNMEARFSRDAVDPATVREAAGEYGLDIVVHLPYSVDIGTPHERAREGACRELEASVDAAATIGAEKAVLHADATVRPDHWAETEVRAGIRESVRRLHEYATGQGVTVCAENLDGRFVDVRDLPEVAGAAGAAMCLDTGHAFATGLDGADQAAFLYEHGDRVAHVHLNDTRARGNDEHLPVGLGRVEFAPLAAAMVETGWTGTCTHEVFGFDGTFAYVRTGKQRFDAMLDAD